MIFKLVNFACSSTIINDITCLMAGTQHRTLTYLVPTVFLNIAIKNSFLPFTDLMSSLTQPAIKRMRLDGSRVQTQGTVDEKLIYSCLKVFFDGLSCLLVLFTATSIQVAPHILPIFRDMTCTIRCDICSTFLCNDHARYSMNKEQGVAGASYKSFHLCSRKSCDILSLETVHAQFPQDFSESGNFCGICTVTLTSARHADCSRIKVACH